MAADTVPADPAQEIERKQEELHAATPPLQQGLALHDGTRLLQVDAAFARLLGYQPSEMVGLNVLRFVAEPDRHLVVQRIRAEGGDRYETNLRSKDGRILRVEVTANRVPFEGGLAHAVAVKLIPDAPAVVPRIWRKGFGPRPPALALTPPKLEPRPTSEILDAVTRELGAAVTPLRLQHRLLRSSTMGELAGPQLQALDIMGRSINRLSDLAQQLHDHGLLQAGTFTVRPVPMLVEPAVNEMLASFKEPAAKARVQLSGHAAANLAVHADPQRFRQVLFNLVSNAIKYTQPGGRVEVEASPWQDRAVVIVRDSGRGIDSSQLDSLFQPFNQLAGAEVGAGPGLGLYVSKGIAIAHGGDLVAESPGPGLGSTFRLIMPLSAPPSPAQTPVPPSDEPLGDRSLAWRMRKLV